MLTLYEVIVAAGHDGDALLSEEVLAETQAQVMTLEQATAVGFSGVKPDPKGRPLRLIAVAPHDARFIQSRLDANDAVITYRIHEIP